MIVFEPLSEYHDASGFTCGTKPFDDYLKREAIYEQRQEVTKTFVAIESTADPRAPVGFFTLKATDKSYAPTPGGLRQLFHPVELVYLARDLAWRKTGLGQLLLIEALRLSLEASERIGLPGVFVRSTGQGMRLYESFEFTRLEPPMGVFFFMPMRKVRDILQELNQR